MGDLLSVGSGGGEEFRRSVKSFGAVGDWNPTTNTGTDDRTAINSGLAWLSTTGNNGELYFPPGNFRASKYSVLAGARGGKISGSAFASIYYASDDPAVVADGIALSDNQARSALLLKNCSDVIIEGLTFVGGDHPNILTTNLGTGVSATKTVGLQIKRCVSRLGVSLLAQDNQNPSAGIGDSIAVSSGIVTLTDSAALFNVGHIGRYVTVMSTTKTVNSGVFEVLSATSTTITFRNDGASAETSSFVWTIDDNDRDTAVLNCRIERFRGVMYTPSYSRVISCDFEQPMTVDLVGMPSAFAIVSTTVTMTDPNSTFNSTHVGRYVRVSGATSAGNNGVFKILTVVSQSASVAGSITYTNAAGVSEAAPRGTALWWIPGGDKVGIGVTLSHSAGTMTLTAAADSFHTSDVGRVIHINKPTSANNRGVFEILTATNTTVTFANSGTTEAYTEIWQIDSRDSIPNIGSTHAIYFFAGREHVLVDGCTFRGVRKTCVKASGSSAPIRGIKIVNCSAIECGQFTAIGADDFQEHSDCLVQNNVLRDVATGRTGWLGQIGIEILGSRGVQVRDNHIHYTRPAVSLVNDDGSVGGNYAIKAYRYSPGYSQFLEDIIIAGNTITSSPRQTRAEYCCGVAISVEDAGLLAKYGTGGTLTKVGNTMTLAGAGFLYATQADVGKAIRLAYAPNAGNNGTFIITSVDSATSVSWTNAGGTGGVVAAGTFAIFADRPHPPIEIGNTGSGCHIIGNIINAVGQVAIRVDDCVGPVITNNTWTNMAYGVRSVGCAMPFIKDNREGSPSTAAAIFLEAGTTWPTVGSNTSSSPELSVTVSQRTPFLIADAAGSLCDYPLLGLSGRARPTDAQEELTLGYGSAFVDGDKVEVDGQAFVYKASAPGAFEFNSFAGLVTLIDALAGIVAADYGTGLAGGDVATQHIRMRRNVTSTTDANSYCYLYTVANPTALVLLRNAVAGNVAYQTSRGSGAAGPTANKTVLWSQHAQRHQAPMLTANNASARTIMGGGYQTNKNTNDSGCCEVLEHDASAGTEEFRWSMV